MSATNRGRERITDDAYETPSWCVRRLFEKIQLPGGMWLEPCAGTGKIIRAVNEVRTDVSWAATEIRKECLPDLMKLGFDKGAITDFLTLDPDRLRSFDAAVSNPPYNLAYHFIECCLESCANVVFLLRLNFLGSVERLPFFQNHMPDVYVLPNRPSFCLGRTDATEYCWMHFVREKKTDGVITMLANTDKAIRKTINDRNGSSNA